MRRTLGPRPRTRRGAAVLAALTLTGTLTLALTACGGGSDGSTVRDPAGSPSSSPAATDGPVDFTQVAMVSMTGGGGRVSTRGTVLGDDAAIAAYARQFRTGAVGDQIRAKAAAAHLPDGRSLVVAVVAIGCDVPPGVHVTAAAGGVVVTPDKVASPLPECLAPVTSIALVSVPSSAVGG
ncbi:MAG: hypothetical protein ACXVEJ_11180 [Nocardioides sp.]